VTQYILPTIGSRGALANCLWNLSVVYWTGGGTSPPHDTGG